MSIAASKLWRSRAVDAGVCIAMTAAAVLYVTQVWPHDLFVADEGMFLYESKRVLDGDLIYRDFFNIVPPGGMYFFALAYRIFGVSMETARLAHAATHAAIILLSYAICHTLRVRRTIAVTVALADITYAYQALPMASVHWIGTMLTLAVLLTVLRLRAGREVRTALWIGISCGALATVQHQKAAFVSAAVLLVMVLDHLLVQPRQALASLPKRLATFAAGMALILVPLAVVFVFAAGAERVFDALVYHPLFQYRSYHRVRWGAASWLHPELYVRPDLMQRWPLIVPIVALQFIWNAMRRADADYTRRPLALACIGAGVVASIMYYPDYIHLGSVAPVVFVLVAWWSESVLRVAEHWLRIPQLVGTAMPLLLWWPMIEQAHINQDIRHQLYPISHQAEFGRVNVKYRLEVDLIETIRELVREAPENNLLFCYPGCSSIYLQTGTRNPTRFQLLMPGYNTSAQFDEVIAELERQAVPYVVIIGTNRKGGPDPLRGYLQAHYTPVRFTSERALVHRLLKRRPPGEAKPFF